MKSKIINVTYTNVLGSKEIIYMRAPLPIGSEVTVDRNIFWKSAYRGISGMREILSGPFLCSDKFIEISTPPAGTLTSPLISHASFVVGRYSCRPYIVGDFYRGDGRQVSYEAQMETWRVVNIYLEIYSSNNRSEMEPVNREDRRTRVMYSWAYSLEATSLLKTNNDGTTVPATINMIPESKIIRPDRKTPRSYVHDNEKRYYSDTY